MSLTTPLIQHRTAPNIPASPSFVVKIFCPSFCLSANPHQLTPFSFSSVVKSFYFLLFPSTSFCLTAKPHQMPSSPSSVVKIFCLSFCLSAKPHQLSPFSFSSVVKIFLPFGEAALNSTMSLKPELG